MRTAEYYIGKYGREKATLVIQEILDIILIPKATVETLAIYRYHLELKYEIQKTTEQDVKRESDGINHRLSSAY